MSSEHYHESLDSLDETTRGALILSLRGGDFQLSVGQDFSIGYLEHTAASVRLYLQESFTFRVNAPEAAIPLRYEEAASL